MNNPENKKEVWFVYDGECPLCTNAALAISIKNELGTLNLLNAREASGHPLLHTINKQGYDLDAGMVIYDGNRFYHGKDALSFMARFGRNHGLLNLINKALFWSDSIASLMYPWLRGTRNLLLKNKKITQIDNLNLKSEPIFKNVFGDAWYDLPIVMQKHYANRPYTNDTYTVEGSLDIMCAGPIKLLSPLLWLMKGVPPHNENNVRTTVHFESHQDTKAFTLNRVFHFKTRSPYHFQSSMIQTTNNGVIELMRFGIGWKSSFHWEDTCVKLKHKGYVLKLFGHFIPVPLTALIGEGNAVEKAIDDNTFDMQTDITHPWWGKIYEYKGRFQLKEKH